MAYAGGPGYSASSGTGTLTVASGGGSIPTGIAVAAISGKAGATVTLQATLTRTDTHAGLQSKTLTFAVNGTTVGTATTYSTGLATKTYVIPTGTAPGNETVTVTFTGDSTDAASTGTGTLTVTTTGRTSDEHCRNERLRRCQHRRHARRPSDPLRYRRAPCRERR